MAAIAVTHQRETFTCVTEDGAPLRPAMLWLDVRATAEVAEYGTPAVNATTGKPPNPTPSWYMLRWLRRHEPETLVRADRVVDVAAYIVHKLTGHWRTSWASADPMGLLDMRTFDYDYALLAAAGLRREQLPELYPAGAVLGDVPAALAAELGLPHGVPVVAGVGDGQSAGLGTGTVEPGSAYLNLGTGLISGTYSETYSTGVEYRVMAGGVPRTYVFETFIGGGTFNISWFVEKFSGVDTRALGLNLSAEQILETAAAQLPPGAEGLLALPYWTGALTPYWDSNARGTLVGLTGSHGKAHVYPGDPGGAGVRAAAAHRRRRGGPGQAAGADRRARRWWLPQCRVVPDHRRRPAAAPAHRPGGRGDLPRVRDARRSRRRAAPLDPGRRHGDERHRCGVPAPRRPRRHLRRALRRLPAALPRGSRTSSPN